MTFQLKGWRAFNRQPVESLGGSRVDPIECLSSNEETAKAFKQPFDG